MILIAGGSGHLGRALVPLLSGGEDQVRVLTRDAERARRALGAGVDLVVGDAQDPASLVEAMKGVRAVVSAITGFGPGGAGPSSVDLAGNLNLIRAAEAAGVGHFVMLSMRGASADHPMELLRMKFRAEEALRASGLSWTIVRPTVFMELWAGMVGDPIRSTGRTTLLGRGDNSVNFVSVTDLARFVKVALTDQELRGRVLDVGGPEDLTLKQVVKSFEALYGRPVHVRHVPVQVLKLASVVLRPFRGDLAGLISASIEMDSSDMTFDASDLERAYPEIELTKLATVARNVFEAAPAS